jgi:cytochrome P450
VQFAPRRALAQTTLHGVEIRPNDFVLCWIGSANRDPRVFDDGERFDPLREKNPHIAFGFGPHYCLGANLARLEARVALEALLARTSRIERAWTGDLPLHPSPVFRGVTRLPVRLAKA